MYLIFIKKIYIFNLAKCSVVVEKYHVMCLHYIINILSHGINPGGNIDSMTDEVKKKPGNISTTILFQPNCSCMFKRCIFIRILVLRTYSYLRIPLNGRFVFLYFSYSLCIFIFHVFFVRHR